MKNMIIFLLLSTFAIGNVQSQTVADLRKKSFNVGKSGLAIEGYDPVAYFTSGKAIEGKKQWAVVTDGILYYFSSAANKELFKANPGKYQPQYGGWCAYAMGNTGEKVSVDPETFKIKDGKLYLFYNRFFTNTLDSWNKDETALQNKADVNWTKLFH